MMGFVLPHGSLSLWPLAFPRTVKRMGACPTLLGISTVLPRSTAHATLALIAHMERRTIRIQRPICTVVPESVTALKASRVVLRQERRVECCASTLLTAAGVAAEVQGSECAHALTRPLTAKLHNECLWGREGGGDL